MGGNRRTHTRFACPSGVDSPGALVINSSNEVSGPPGASKMAQGSIALPQVQLLRPTQWLGQLVPGVLLLAAIGYLGKICEQSLSAYGKAHHLPLPNIEYVLWAILIGLAASNTIGIPAVFQPGVATYEFWLKTGIVLLGSRFLLGDVLRLGGLSLTLVVLELAVAFSLMTLLGRWFGSVSYTHLRAHETDSYLVCRLLLEKKKKQKTT